MKIILVFVAMFFSFKVSAVVAEPPFCDLKTFRSSEISQKADGLTRMHGFKLGKVNIIGLGVGESDTEAVKKMAMSFSEFSAEEKYCTWYLNDGNPVATKTFHDRNIGPNPLWPWFSKEFLADDFEKNLSGMFTTDAITVQACAEKHGFVALGCDGMRHRGPSGFSMLLSFAGCTPESSVKIVQKMWPVEWYRGPVSDKKRLAIAERAYRLGLANPEQSKKLRDLLQ